MRNGHLVIGVLSAGMNGLDVDHFSGWSLREDPCIILAALVRHVSGAGLSLARCNTCRKWGGGGGGGVRE